jgi:hypothetical protein
MAIEAKVRYGCLFCGARQESDAVCRRCERDRTLDLADAGVRDLFRDTDARAREQREGKAKMYGAIAAMLVMAAFFAVQLAFGILSKGLVMLAVASGFAVAWAVISRHEKSRRSLFPWLDTLGR